MKARAAADRALSLAPELEAHGAPENAPRVLAQAITATQHPLGLEQHQLTDEHRLASIGLAAQQALRSRELSPSPRTRNAPTHSCRCRASA